MSSIPSPSFFQKVFAWSVHLFTASGLLAGFMAILAINEKDWRMAMIWLVISLVIDGIDGTFARMARVKEVLPYMDGTTIDYVIDFATYAIIPAYFFHQAELVPEDWRLACTAIILLVSALYYGKTGMVSDDMYFIGFPVLWNMVVFYMIFIFHFSPVVNAAFILAFAILHFVPIKFVYPSQAKSFKALTVGVTVVFILSLLLILYYFPVEIVWLRWAAILCMIYYAGMGVYNTWIEK